jgi:hypothetical protein
MGLPWYSISGPNPIAVPYPTAALRSTLAPRRIAYSHRYADPCPIAVRRSIVSHHLSLPRLRWSPRIGTVSEQVVNIAKAQPTRQPKPLPPLHQAATPEQRRQRFRSLSTKAALWSRCFLAWRKNRAPVAPDQFRNSSYFGYLISWPA